MGRRAERPGRPRPARLRRLITGEGRDAIARAEQLTNRLATAPWSGLSDARLVAVAEALAPFALAAAPIYPQPNPIGMPTPWDAAADPAGDTILADPTAR